METALSKLFVPFLSPLLGRGYALRKEFAPSGSKFFPCRVDPFIEGVWRALMQRGSRRRYLPWRKWRIMYDESLSSGIHNPEVVKSVRPNYPTDERFRLPASCMIMTATHTNILYIYLDHVLILQNKAVRFFFLLLFGFYGPFKNISLILSWLFIKGGRKPKNPGKTTCPSASRTWFSHIWPELLCFRHLPESRFLLGALNRRSKFANFCHDLMQNHLS